MNKIYLTILLLIINFNLKAQVIEFDSSNDYNQASIELINLNSGWHYQITDSMDNIVLDIDSTGMKIINDTSALKILIKINVEQQLQIQELTDQLSLFKWYNNANPKYLKYNYQ
jgi:hypothetical protein